MSKKKLDREPRSGDVVDLTHDGRGVCRHDGKTVFVPDSLPGEKITYRLNSGRRNFDVGEVVSIDTPSPHRVVPKCAHFGVCGACSLQHLEPTQQLVAKQKHLAEVFTRIGALQPENWLPALTGPHWGYRRRGRLGVKYVHKKERVLVGFRERAKPYVADMARCEVLDPRVGTRLTELAEMIQKLDGRERIPQIEIAAGDDAVVLVFRHLEPLSDKDLAILREFELSTGLHIYLQPAGMDSIAPLSGVAADLRYALPAYDVDLAFEAADFVQINASLNQDMIKLALDLLEIKPGDRVLELFAGLGNFTLPLARTGAQVVAVEGEAALVARGRENATRQGLDAEYHVADLFKPQDAAPWMTSGYNKVLLDPPRAGAEEILPAVLAYKPERIVYVSCHPASLARDARIIVAAGYRCVQAGVMDMFPHTGHVESIASFVWA